MSQPLPANVTTDPQLDGDLGALPEGKERRRSVRHAESASAWLSGTASKDRGCTVAVDNLSLHGVGFCAAEPVEVGSTHWMLITRGPMRLSTRIRIQSCRQRDDGRHDVGGEFY